MTKNQNQPEQPKEGGTDFAGLENFIVDVNTGGQSSSSEEEIEIDLGENTSEEEETSKQETSDESKGEETPKQEESQEEPKGNEEKSETPKENQSDSYYGKLASKFLEKGKWQDAEIEKADGSVVKLSELEDIDEETFFAIEENQTKFKEEDLKNNYIKKGDFDENKLKVIEILKEGGDIKDIFEKPEDAERPFEGVDMDDEKNQKGILYNYLTQVQKHDPEDAKVLVNNQVKRGTLEEKSKEIVEGYQKQYDQRLTEKLEAIKKENEERKAKDKEFSKQLEETYKNYSLEPKIAKKLASLGTKRTDDGDFELDSIYSEKLENPQDAAELIYFLVDREGYLKDKMAETKVKTQQSNLKQIKLIPDKGKKSNSSNESTDSGASEFVVSVE